MPHRRAVLSALSVLASRPVLAAVPALPVLWLAGCAALPGYEAPRVTVANIASLPGEGMEVRLALKLRIQNPNSSALEFQGVSLTLDVRDTTFASGVSPESGVVPGFGERVITVPVSVGALAAVRQIYGWIADGGPKLDYVLRGRLGGPPFGGHRFESTGRLEWPKGARAPVPDSP
jgi:hypothetical protein